MSEALDRLVETWEQLLEEKKQIPANDTDQISRNDEAVAGIIAAIEGIRRDADYHFGFLMAANASAES
jgi:hypothetical protein